MDRGYNNDESSTAPEPNRWYNITLGPSLSDGYSNSPRFYTLRYEFKPASIDNTQPGSFHKSSDKSVRLEFENNQPGKPKVSFDGVCEDYNDKDAVLFFDGETFRLEKLHRAVKRLKYQRSAGESAATLNPTTYVAPVTEPCSQPVSQATKVDPPVTNTAQPVKAAQIDINNPVSLEDTYPSASIPGANESEEDVNIDDDDDEDNDVQDSGRIENTSTKELRCGGLDIDINLPHPGQMEDDEIAVVDINDDESYKGLNAAEALRAQVNAQAREEERSSSSSSGRESESSESSGSGSGSSSSESRNSGSQSGTASEGESRASH